MLLSGHYSAAQPEHIEPQINSQSQTVMFFYLICTMVIKQKKNVEGA